MRNMFGATTLGDGDCSAGEVFGEDGGEDGLEELGVAGGGVVVEEVSLRRSSVASPSSISCAHLSGVVDGLEELGVAGGGVVVEEVSSRRSFVASSSSISCVGGGEQWSEWCGRLDDVGGDDDDDVDDFLSVGISSSVEVGVEVGNVVGIRRLCRPDDDDFLGEVGGSTSRSCDNLLFLLEVGGVIGVGD